MVGSQGILMDGTDAQRRKYLVPLAEGDVIISCDADMILGDNGNIYRLVGITVGTYSSIAIAAPCMFGS